MRPLSLKLRGVTRFTGAVDLDLSGLSGLVAVTGPNGAGKTTIMESLLPAALYREMPSRGKTLGAACSRPSVLDLTIEHDGAVWRALHQVDPTAAGGRGKAEAVLYRDGIPLTGGRLTDFDQAVAAAFPPSSVVLASVFAAQGGIGSFASLSPVDRRDLLAKILGLEELQRLAERAREARKTCDAIAADLGERYAVAVAAREQGAALRAELDGYHAALVAAEARVDEARATEEGCALTLATATAVAEERWAQVEALERRARDLGAQRDAILAAMHGAGRDVTAARTALHTLHGLREAEALRVAMEADRTEIRQRYTEELARARAAKVDSDRAFERTNERDRVEAHRRTIGARLAALPTVDLEELAHLDATAGEALAEAQRAVPEPLARPEGVQSTRAAVARAEADAGLIAGVPCASIDVPFPCRFLGGARAGAEGLAALRAELARLEGAEVEWGMREAQIRSARARLDMAAAGATRSREALRAAQGTEEQRTALAVALAALPAPDADDEGRRRHIEVVLGLRQEAVDRALRDGVEIKAAIDSLGDTAGRLRVAELAAGRLPDLEERWARLTADGERVAAEIVALPQRTGLDDRHSPVMFGLRAALERSRGEVRTGRAALEGLAATRARTEGRLLQLGDVEGAVLDAQRRRVELDRTRSGLVLLERALGREGIQALEIDAAGPELSELTTELLAAIVGPRWAIQLRTIREAEGAKKTREVCELLAIDGLRGGTRTVDQLSGGELTVVEEALKLAIAVYNARRTGIRWGALWRDECDGRLDPAIAARYPEMLRRAAELGGFEVVYFVTHREELAAQADARIRISEAGAVSVEVA